MVCTLKLTTVKYILKRVLDDADPKAGTSGDVCIAISFVFRDEVFFPVH